jgi:hypothetical protein
MPYLGNPLATAFSTINKQDLTGGTGTSFTLNYSVGSSQDIEVFVNNVRQEPVVAYTANGTSLTMTGTIAATDDFYVVFQGKAQQTVVPGAGTLTRAMLASGVTMGAGYFQGNNGNTGDTTNGKGDIFRVHSQTLTNSVTIGSTDNAMAVGPLTIDSSVTLTVNGNLTVV